jgi:RecA/RadA recombinase
MEIFDAIETPIAAQCQEGMPLKLVIIDSINGIKGRRSMNQDSIETQNIGDEALTLGAGFRRILGVQRKYGFAVILTCQIRAEMNPLEIKRRNLTRLSMPFAVQHYAEYHMSVEKDRNVTGRTDLAGNEFKDDSAGDIEGKGDQTGHKIRAKMLDNSCGPKGRLASFTIDYNKGVINQFEEVLVLGINRGVIERPNNLTYMFGDKKWTGKPALLEAIKNDKTLQDTIMNEVFSRDKLGKFQADDDKAAAELDSSD